MRHFQRLSRNLPKAEQYCLQPRTDIFSALLAGSGYNQAADVALGTAAQTAAVQSAISVSYIWVETVCYIIGGLLLLIFWTVEKNLPAEQTEIAARKAKQ